MSFFMGSLPLFPSLHDMGSFVLRSSPSKLWGRRKAVQAKGRASVNKQKLDQAKIMKCSDSDEQDRVKQDRAL